MSFRPLRWFGVGGPAACEKAAKRCTDAERKRDSAQPQGLKRTVGPTLINGDNVKRFILAFFCMAAVVGPALGQSQTTTLADLIRTGNRKAALDRIRSGADVNEAQPDGTRPIHWAVYKVDYELIDALIAKKAKVDVKNEFGSAPLTEAAKLADARMVKMLLDAEAPVDAANEDGETALMLAIKTGELPIVEMLVKAGANVNTVEKYQNQTPLMWAVTAPQNAVEMTKLLLSKGANVKPRALYTDWPNQLSSEPRGQYRPVGGLTALLYASRNGCYNCVEALIGSGADVNVPTPEGVTPLMVALDNDYNDVANLLLDRGANPHISDWWGRTALFIAIDRKGAAGGGRGGAGGRGAGGRGTAAASRGSRAVVSSMDIINRLLAADVDVNAELNMHRPSRGGNSGRFSDRQLSTGTTPLYRATEAGDMEVIRALLAKGANPNINGMGFTPFLVAAGVTSGGRGGGGGGAPNTTLLDLMIQHGADVNAQVTGTRTYSMRISYNPPPDKEGTSALHEAVQAGRTDMVRYLLEKGANPELVDANGKKPIDLLSTGDGGGRGRGGAPAPGAAAGGRGRGGAGGGAVSPATAAEIRAMLQDAAAKK
jgi:ankyrin repeat protein